MDEPILTVDGPPRSGLSIFGAQIQRASLGGALLLDARRPETARRLHEPKEILDGNAGVTGYAGRVLVLDHAELEPEGALAFARGAVAMGPRSRVVLLGHNIGGTELGATGPRSSASAERPIRRLELCPLGLYEVGRDARNRNWLRGGYPEAFMAPDDAAAFSWLGSYAENAVGAILAAAGIALTPARLRSLLLALAGTEGQSLNESAIAAGLGLSRPALSRCLSALVDSGIIRLLPSFPIPSPAADSAGSEGRRRSPILYFRDSGLLHAVLGLESRIQMEESAALAASWEGYVIEQCLAGLPEGIEAAQYESRNGARLELVLMKQRENKMEASRPLLGASIALARRGRGSSVPRSALYAARCLAPELSCLVLPDAEEAILADGFRVMGLGRFLELVASLE